MLIDIAQSGDQVKTAVQAAASLSTVVAPEA
jgi:hypothetical protein